MFRKIIIGLNLFFLVLIILFGFMIFQQKRHETIRKFLSQYESKVFPNHPELTGGEVVKDGQLWVYFTDHPADSELAQRLQSKLPEAGKSAFSTSINQVSVLYAKSEESPLAGTRLETIQKVNHSVSGLSVKEIGSQSLETLYFKEDGSRLTLNDFISKKAKFRELVDKKLNSMTGEAGVSTQPFGGDSIASLMTEDDKKAFREQLANTDWSGLSFSYTDRVLRFENGFELGLSDFYEAVNGDYLTGKEREDFDNYMQKVNAEREQKKIDEKWVAITFDDGPNPETTGPILEILARYNAVATFYILGQKIEGNEALLKDMLNAGHEFGNHTWSHPNLAKIGFDGAMNEINNTTQAINNALGSGPKSMRPPYGSTTEEITSNLELPTVLWDVDTLDWQSHNTEAIMGEIKKTIQPGSIVLMHDIHQSTVDALPVVMDYLVSEGYQFVTVSEMNGY